MVLDLLNQRAREQSANAFNRDRKNLLVMWNWGQDFLKIGHNPLLKIRKRPHDSHPEYIPPVRDVLKVLAAATREERVFLNCYIHTGARKSEIFRWTWHEDINLERKQYRLGTKKTCDGSMEYEWFPMPDDLLEELVWWWKNRPVKDAPYVFVSTSPRYYGQPFTYRRRFLKGLCKRAGVTEFGFKSLRTFLASLLADSGKVSMETIRRLLRHKNVRTTERYIRHLHQDLKPALNVVGESLHLDTQEKRTPERDTQN